MHDDTLDRTTTGSGRTAEHDLAALRALRLKNNAGEILDEGVPTLREALDRGTLVFNPIWDTHLNSDGMRIVARLIAQARAVEGPD